MWFLFTIRVEKNMLQRLHILNKCKTNWGEGGAASN